MPVHEAPLSDLRGCAASGRRAQRFPSIRRRGGRALALLATCSLLGLAGIVAGSTTPAFADSFFVQLAASPPTLPVGGTTTLTAATGTDVGPTPWYIDIFDITTGTVLAYCGSGTTCVATVSQNTATTHAFVAYVAAASSTPPPASIQGTSDTSYVTWTNSGMRVTLSGPEVDNIQSNGPATYTATANIDVHPTGYVIEIYDETARTLLGFSTTGSTYSVVLEPSVVGDYLVAFIATFIEVVSQTYPPPLSSVQGASSNILFTRGFYG